MGCHGTHHSNHRQVESHMQHEVLFRTAKENIIPGDKLKKPENEKIHKKERFTHPCNAKLGSSSKCRHENSPGNSQMFAEN